MAAQSITIVINEVEIPVLLYRDKPVLTTEHLARLYGTDPNNIQQNFKRNADRFEADKHFFKVIGEELQAFKNQLTNCQLVGARASHLTLWTERGAARHAKMLDTDQAWDVFEKLETAYFDGIKTAAPQPVIHTAEELISPAQTAEIRQLVWLLGRCYHLEGAGEYAGFALVRENFGVANAYKLPARRFSEALALLQWAERLSLEFKRRVIEVERKFLKSRFRVCPPELEHLAADTTPGLLLRP